MHVCDVDMSKPYMCMDTNINRTLLSIKQGNAQSGANLALRYTRRTSASVRR